MPPKKKPILIESDYDSDSSSQSTDSIKSSESVKSHNSTKSNNSIKSDNSVQSNNEFDLSNMMQLNPTDKNAVIRERLFTIEKIIEMYPNLKKDKDYIIDNIMNKKEEKPNTYILEKIIINKNAYYKDPYGFIIDSDTKMVGLYTNTQTTIICYMLDYNKNILTKYDKLLENMAKCNTKTKKPIIIKK